MLVVAFRGIPDVRTTETVNEGELLAAVAQRRTAAARAEGGGGDDDDNGRRNGRGGAGEGGDPPPGPSDDGAGPQPPPPVVIKVLWIPEAPAPYNLNASEVRKDSNIFANIKIPLGGGRLLVSYTRFHTVDNNEDIDCNQACMQLLVDAESLALPIKGAQVVALRNTELPPQPQIVMAIPTDETGMIIASGAVGYWLQKIEKLTLHKPIIWVPKLDTVWQPDEFGSMLRECDRDGFPEYFERFTKEPEEPEEEGVVFHTPCYSVTEAIQHVLAAAAQKR